MVHLTGNPIYDAVGSITISGLLGCTAIFLIQQNRSLLLGKPLCQSDASFRECDRPCSCRAHYGLRRCLPFTT